MKNSTTAFARLGFWDSQITGHLFGRGCHREPGVILEAIDYLERGFEFISKTLRNPQNAAREFLAADFCTVSNFFFEVAYSFVDLVQRECARHHPAPS
ncbi:MULTISPECIES: hypothetical protein [Bradyrhizobium]|uniref:hypothetical protein n=1 Tax=Bradyrhizobium TaxID=374 RepID=UPI0024E0F04A|nr:hypothetical protein [Bradyrhizobium liaoningense]